MVEGEELFVMKLDSHSDLSKARFSSVVGPRTSEGKGYVCEH